MFALKLKDGLRVEIQRARQTLPLLQQHLQEFHGYGHGHGHGNGHGHGQDLYEKKMADLELTTKFNMVLCFEAAPQLILKIKIHHYLLIN